MDLRIVKTRKNIRVAFLELRAKNALEKIKVSKLCEMALINKTTFYKHYQDIFALSEEIENETLASIMEGFGHLDSLFSDPDSFFKGLYFVFNSHEEIIRVLFSDRMNVLIDKVEKYLLLQYPALQDYPEKEIILSFTIWGASHLLNEPRYDKTVLLEVLSKVARRLVLLIEE